MGYVKMEFNGSYGFAMKLKGVIGQMYNKLKMTRPIKRVMA